MAFYDLTFDGTDQIIFNAETEGDTNNAITKMVFKMNTLNNDTLNRSSSVRCEFEISGKITENNKDQVLKLAKWSMVSGGDEVYRKVNITVYKDDTRQEVLRNYKIDKMFCIDYDEEFNEQNDESGIGLFNLHIAQREGKYSKDVFAI